MSITIPSYNVVQIDDPATHHIQSDSHSTNAPEGLAVSLNSAANSCTPRVKRVTFVTLCTVARGGGLLLAAFLSTYSLREVSNFSSEKESEIWKSQMVSQKRSIYFGMVVGGVGGVLAGNALQTPQNSTAHYKIVPLTIVGIYIGLILSYLLTQADFSGNKTP